MRYHLGMEEPKRPPSDRGQGRKPLVEGLETVPVNIRMTTEQRDKLKALGGPVWVRDKIDRAKVKR